MDFTPDKGTRRSKRPRFGFQAKVEVYTPARTDGKPTAVLLITGWAWSYDQAHGDVRYDALQQLKDLQVPAEALRFTQFEISFDAWFALDAKHVRNPEGLPVTATRHADAKERDTLIRQQRLVPDDWHDSSKVYSAVLKTSQADTDSKAVQA